MTPEESRALVLKLLGDVAPEADLQTLKPDRPLREQIEIDSVDFLGLVTKIHKATGIDVPETDYAKLDTLDLLVAYLSAKAPKPC
jgi:acyl carrier protein